MATVDPDIIQPPDAAESVQGTKPNAVPPGADDPYSGAQYDPPPDKKYWIQCLADAERAEQEWRKRGREIIQIYRNEQKASKSKALGTTFNILYANTEVMLTATYQQPPKPVVRSRFQNVAPPPAIPMGPPPGLPPPPGAGPVPPGMPPMPPGGPMGAPPPPAALPMPGGGPMPPGPPPGPPLDAVPAPLPQPPGAGANPPAAAPPGPLPPQPPLAGGGGPPLYSGALPPPMPTPPIPGKLDPADIDTAASVMQKALEVVLDSEHSNEAIKNAVKDVLLPGRGVCRVRWQPEMKTEPVTAGDGTTPLPLGGVAGAEPATTERKIWEEVLDEYVFWEDLLIDPVRQAGDTDWIAFRHLFTRETLEREFAGSPEYDKLKAAGQTESLFRWTDESAAKSPVGGGAALKSAKNLGDYVKKAMIWEIWHRPTRRIIWFIREVTGLVLRIDPDSYQLMGFYPIPVPLLAVTTSDSRIPRPYYDLYAALAADLDETSARISALTKHIKARGAYNSASKDIADLLTAGDNKMVPVDGVDMLNGGLQNHIWMLPIEIYVQALTQLYIARDQIKQAIYEIMGISDIMRGATKATETATAQRIKGSMGMGRLQDQKQAAEIFVRDLLRLKAELIAQNFDPQTLEAMTGETVTPEVISILRSDFQRSCAIDIESDSTVIPDIQAEQQGMAMVMQSVQLVMQGTQQMLMTQILPPPQVLQLGMELLKMALHPVPYSRGAVEVINGFQKQLQMMPPMPPIPAPPPAPPGGPPGAGPPPDKGKGQPGNNAAQPPPVPQGMPPGMPPPPGLQ